MKFPKWFLCTLGKKRKRTDDGDGISEYPPNDYNEDSDEEFEEFDEYEDFIIHPDKSQKSFKSMVLENGLSVLLISDPSVSYASAAMTVKYGSFHDPVDMMGLAHLIEHMLFNGTHENRGVNEFREFVNMYGGEVYAYTDMEYSGYSFAIDEPGFEVALKMFANMFISPLMDVDHIEEEISTINQEFELKRSFDSSRIEYLNAHTSPKDHIFNNFHWGNSKSFSEHDRRSIHAAALEKFQIHFGGVNMKLVIVAADPLNFLEKLAIDNFTRLPCGTEINLVYPKYDPYKWKHGLWNHGVAFVLESLEKSQCMKISWIIPPVSENHSEKRPEKLIQIVLSDEGQGSLYALFKSKLWITSLTTTVGYEAQFSDVSDSAYTSTIAGQIFTISIDITDCGWDHRYEMVSYVYQFLNFLKTVDYQSLSVLINEDILSRRMKFACLEFDNDEICNPTQFSLAIAVNMLKVPVINALSLDYDYSFGDAQDFKEMLGNFITKNMRIDILSKPFMEEGEIVPFFSFKYKQEPIPLSYLCRWEACEILDPALRLPSHNQLLPKRFWEVLEGHVEAEIGESGFECIGDKSFYKDDKQMLSRASINIYLNPGVGVVSHTISRILFEMLKHELSPLMLKGELAYISSQLSYGDDNAIVLQLKGYHEKFKELITSIWETFKSFKATRDSFKYITEKMKSEFSTQSLLEHAISLLLEAVTDGDITTERKYLSLELISFEELERLVPTLLSETRTVSVFSGKLSKEDCIQISDLFQSAGNFEIQSKAIRKLSNSSPYRVSAKPFPRNHTNCLAMVYFQLLTCKEKCEVFDADLVTAFVHLFKALIDEKLHCHLRLGLRVCYDLGCEVYNILGTTGTYIYVSSSDYKAGELMEMIHTFVSQILEYLEDLNVDTFNIYKDSVYIPDDSGISPELINDDSVINAKTTAAETFLEGMLKEDFINLFKYFFVLKASTIEVYIE